MKAEKLMIGDYVTVTPSGMTIRIAAVHHKKVAYHACTDRLEWVRQGLLNPIPLTPEILEKNGFEKAQSLYFLKSLNKRYPYLIFIEYNIVNNCLFVNDGLIPMPILYVHQLQHVLRLCGTEKEVKL